MIPFQEPEWWLRLITIYYCALRLWSRTGVIYQSFGFLYLVVLSCCAGTGCLGPAGWLHVCEKDMGPKFGVPVVKC